jgi:hypothetical protein
LEPAARDHGPAAGIETSDGDDDAAELLMNGKGIFDQEQLRSSLESRIAARPDASSAGFSTGRGGRRTAAPHHHG